MASCREEIKIQSSDHLLECLKWLLTKQNASDINNYLTRQVCSGYLSVPRHGTNLFQSTLIYRAITEWNSLPNHVIITNTRAAFKKEKKGKGNMRLQLTVWMSIVWTDSRWHILLADWGLDNGSVEVICFLNATHEVCVCQSPVPPADVVMLANGDTELVNPWTGLCFPFPDLNDSVKQLDVDIQWPFSLRFQLSHMTWFTVTFFTPECWLCHNLWLHHHHHHNCPNFPTAAPPPIPLSTSAAPHSFTRSKKIWSERLWGSRVWFSLTVSLDVSHRGARVTLLSL